MSSKIEQLEKEKNQYLKNLTIPELKGYIDNLIKNYYDSYITNDSKRLKDNIEEINLFIDDFNTLYPNISNYINSRMVCMSNICLENIFKRNLKLIYPDVDIKEDNFNYREWFDEELIDKIIQEEEEYYRKCKNCRHQTED